MANRRLLATVVAACALSLLAAGCSADPASPQGAPDPGLSAGTGVVEETVGSSGAATPDPCALLTLEEISAVFGDAWGHSEELAPVELPEGQSRTCYYSVEELTSFALGVAVSPILPASVDRYKEASTSGYTGEFALVDIPGLGDAAWASHAVDSPDEAVLWVVKGLLVLSLSPHRLEGATVDKMTALAEVAVPRMP